MNMKFGYLTHSNLYRRQRGMTLVAGLIFLVILTLVSVLGFRNVTLSERMAGNSADRNVSLQSAESVGKEAITLIEAVLAGTATWPTTSPNIGYYDHTTETPAMSSVMAIQGGGNTYWTAGNVTVSAATPSTCAAAAAFDWVNCSNQVSTKYANNADRGRYVIELISVTTSGSTTTRVYRVTARSTGGTGESESILQTMYTKTTT
jgi:type IV pilus assembly protein PilX